MVTQKEKLLWRKKHLENLLWAGKKTGDAYWKKNAPVYRKELSQIKLKLKRYLK